MDNKIFELADKLKAEKDENCDYLFFIDFKTRCRYTLFIKLYKNYLKVVQFNKKEVIV